MNLPFLTLVGLAYVVWYTCFRKPLGLDRRIGVPLGVFAYFGFGFLIFLLVYALNILIIASVPSLTLFVGLAGILAIVIGAVMASVSLYNYVAARQVSREATAAPSAVSPAPAPHAEGGKDSDPAIEPR
jgi:hypothetical protein